MNNGDTSMVFLTANTFRINYTYDWWRLNDNCIIRYLDGGIHNDKYNTITYKNHYKTYLRHFLNTYTFIDYIV